MRAIARTLLEQCGQTCAEEAGIHLEKNTPTALFQHLYVSLCVLERAAV